MNLLVTGAAGFIGSHFVRLVRERRPDWQITILDALTYSGNLLTISEFASDDKVRFYPGRIEDRTVVAGIIERENISDIVNFAAESHNDRSILGDSSFLTSNALGPENLLNLTRDYGLRRMLQVSTDEVYGSILEGRFTEETPISPNTPYSASKAAGEFVCWAHRKAFGTPVLVTRGGNTYGPFQYPEKLISFFTVRLIEGKKVPVYGEGNQVREWMHARDHAAGILHALEHGELGQAYNVGDDNERPNREIVDVLLHATGRDRSLVKNIPDPRGNAHDARYSMETSKLQSLGWKPDVPFEEGFQDTIKWYQNNESWWRPIIEKPEYVSFIKRYYGPSLGSDL